MKRAKPRQSAFVMHRREMLESPAWRSLSLAAKQALDRLEIELMRNGGMNNGQLIVTHQQFAEYGIRYPSIAPAIRLLVKVGLLQITEKGRCFAGRGRPARYRLTYLPADGNPPTDEWKSCCLERTR